LTDNFKYNEKYLMWFKSPIFPGMRSKSQRKWIHIV